MQNLVIVRRHYIELLELVMTLPNSFRLIIMPGLLIEIFWYDEACRLIELLVFDMPYLQVYVRALTS